MYPVIAIIVNYDASLEEYRLTRKNIQAILEAGGLPVMIPYTENKKKIEQLSKQCAGLYLTGGADIDPSLYNEEPDIKLGYVQRERDLFEIAMVQAFSKQNKPLLGVCKGAQIINVAFGGTIYQDIITQLPTPSLQHQQQAERHHMSHQINIKEDSYIYRIVNEAKLYVNSRHHQAIREIGDGLQISAMASDGVIEAIESTTKQFIIGVQWHPEDLLQEKHARNLYRYFIEKCGGY